MPWRIGSMVDLPALLLSGDGGRDSPTPEPTFVIARPDEVLVGHARILSAAGAFAAGRRCDPRGCSQLRAPIDIHVI